MKLTMSPRAQRITALALAAVTAALLLFAVVMPSLAAAQLHDEQVAQLRRQALALQGLIEVAPRYRAIAKTLAANSDSRSLIYVAAQPSLAVADLQSRLTQLLQAAGVTVTQSQALPESEANGLTKITVQATLQVEIGQLVSALHDIGAARPLLNVDRLTVHEPDAEFAGVAQEANVPNKLQAEIVVSAHMRRP